MEIRKILTVLLTLIFTTVFGQDKFISITNFTFDNAFQNSFREYVGYDKNFVIKNKDTSKEDHILDITPLFGGRSYFFNGKENHFTDYRLNTSFKYDKKFSTSTNIYFLNSKSWSPIFFDGLFRYSGKRLSSELFVERELVGTPVTNQMRYVSFSNGLSLDYRLTKKTILVNSLTYNLISDGNDRLFYISRVIYTMKKNSYVDFKLKRMFGGEYSPYYFSPININQYNLGYGFNRTYKPNINIKFYFGLGYQSINNDNMLMMNYDLKINKLYKKWLFEVYFGSKNFNTYIYNVFNTKIAYTLSK